jgi:hypothetical protein
VTGTGGYYSLMAPCYVCGVVFASNPARVPSYENQPICEPCIGLINRRRAELGQPLWPVLEGAYEPAQEGEL